MGSLLANRDSNTIDHFILFISFMLEVQHGCPRPLLCSKCVAVIAHLCHYIGSAVTNDRLCTLYIILHYSVYLRLDFGGNNLPKISIGYAKMYVQREGAV
jgi:hypothetical protein